MKAASTTTSACAAAPMMRTSSRAQTTSWTTPAAPLAKKAAHTTRSRSSIRLAQGEGEGRPLPWRRRRPQPPAVTVDDVQADRQPHPGAAVFLVAPHPSERLEQLARLRRVEPLAVVAHEVDRLRPLLAHPELDARPRLAPGCAPG